jgi:aspartate aminotransferase
MQRLLPHVLLHPLDASEYRRRSRRFVATLEAGGVDVVHPEAGFFAFPRSPIADEQWFCRLLARRGVLCVPGSAFGAPGYFRTSLTQPLARVQEAALRITRCARRALEARTA